MYQFLTIDAKAYLPAPECVTIYFLKDIVRGQKKCKCTFICVNAFLVIKAEDAKHLHVPCYLGLTIKTILEFGMRVESVSQYMPEDRDVPKLPRQWIINVIYSIVGDELREWVS